MGPTITDCLWFLGMMIQPSENEVIQATTTDNKWVRLCSLVKNISTSGIVDSMLLKTSLELNLLVGAGLTKDEVRINQQTIQLSINIIHNNINNNNNIHNFSLGRIK